MKDYTNQFLLIKPLVWNNNQYTNSSIYYKIDAINNISLSKNNSFSEYYGLGAVQLPMNVNAPQSTELSIDRFLMYDNNSIDSRQEDIFYRYSGSNPLSEAIVYDNDTLYKVKNLYLINYSIGFSIGELPRINTKFTSYEIPEISKYNLSDDFKINKSLDYPKAYIPNLSSITILNNDDTPNNIITFGYNIYSFEYSLEINRQPFFSIGSSTPSEVCEILPIKIIFTINSKINSDEITRNKEILTKKTQENLEFKIVILIDDEKNIIFYIKNAQLINSEITLSIENTLELKRTFIGYYGL